MFNNKYDIKKYGINLEFMKNIIWYGIFGLLAAFLEYFIFVILINFNVYPEISNVVGSMCGFVFTFTMNTFFNFKKKNKVFVRLFSYGMICLCGLITTTIIIWMLKNIVNLYILKICCLVGVSGIQFILNKFITYKN